MATIAAPLAMKLSTSTRYICGRKVSDNLKKIGFETKHLVCTKVAQEGAINSFRSHDLKACAIPRASISSTEELLDPSTEFEILESASSYLFRTEIGGHVKVLVGKRSNKYAVYIEVSSLQLLTGKNKLVLSWSTSRMPMDFESSDPGAKTKITETPFMANNSEKWPISMDFETKGTPFNFSFTIKSSVSSDSPHTEIKSHRKARFCVPVGFASGKPAPLGLSFSRNGLMNFSFFSRNAERVSLCLFDESSTNNPAVEIDLDPYVNKTGDIWHALMENSSNFVSYGYRCNSTGKIILDPYAKIIGKSISNNHESNLLLKYPGMLQRESQFVWSGDIRPNIALEKLVVYRLNVMRFTDDHSSELSSDIAGTFSGLIKKLQYFKDLGVNAILLEPIFTFDGEKENGPYYPCQFFSPMNLYGPSGDSVSAMNSMKEMVKTLHENGIEVLLEVVFTHTAEAGALQGIDDSTYYYVSKDSDTKSALNCNYPIVQQLIIDSLRYWVTEFHVDGFCFMNASSLLRGFHGETLSRPPLMETVSFDPILSKTKIIADFCDPQDMIPKEVSFPHWKKWAEMNTKFCSDVRIFLKGDGLLSNLATRLCGSGDIFSHGQGPAFSFNYISNNFGLPLVDLVSFGCSGLASENSWNCGEEGPTTKTIVLERRLKQIRNFLFILYISLGVPVLTMGDECGLSTGGSPAYRERKSFNWNVLKTGFAVQITQFIFFLTSLRNRRSDLLQKINFLEEKNIDWHGTDHQSPPKWDDPASKFLAMTLKADEVNDFNSRNGHLFIAFNAADQSVPVMLLPPPPTGVAWFRLVDTALPFPGFFSEDGEIVIEQIDGLIAYEMKSYSCCLFEARNYSK